MNRFSFQIKRSHVIILIFLYPYIVGFKPAESDSTLTELRVALGLGSFAEVSRDCSGKVLSVKDLPFHEVTASVDHYTPVLHFGVKAGVVSEAAANKLFDFKRDYNYYQGTYNTTPSGAIYYANPIIGLNTKYFGLDAGYILLLHNYSLQSSGGLPTGSLRIGRKDAFHFRYSIGDDLPLITGGPGYGNVGFGFNLGKPQHTLLLSLGTFPYDGLLFGTQVEFPVSDKMLLHLGVSIGGSESTEYGLSASTRIKL